MSNRVIMNFDFLRQYDYTSAKVLLVPSVPGYHRGQTMDAYGHRRLRHLLRQYKVAMDTRHCLIVNVSSFGSLTVRWLVDEFFQKSFGCGNELKIVWPRVDDVRQSMEGYAAGGCLCLSNKNCKPFLFPLFHRWQGAIRGMDGYALMPHIKTYSVVDVEEAKLCFFMLSSANLSKAAWGEQQKNDSQLFVKSFEMGCLFLPQYFEDHYLKHRHRGFCLSD